MIIQKLEKLIHAYDNKLLGIQVMPEDTHPNFKTQEERLSYFTLPMALNYQRNSYKLWESALKTWEDKSQKWVFDIKEVSSRSIEELQEALLKHKIALQPNKHPNTWKEVSKTIYTNFKSISNFLKISNNDFIKIRELIQKRYKKKFPYLSGPKIFNYWAYILTQYGKVDLKNKDHITIAPDTHVIQCSIKLGILTPEEGKKLSKEDISKRWKKILSDTNINPIDLHSPFWFWSRNGFKFQL